MLHFLTTLLLPLLTTASPLSPPSLLSRQPQEEGGQLLGAVTWGPIFYLGPSPKKTAVIQVSTTSYAGRMPVQEKGGLFLWPGIGGKAESGEWLVQSVQGGYKKGYSSCTGAKASQLWCVSSEIYGPSKAGQTGQTQYVGEKRALLDDSPHAGVVFTYTLVDALAHTWYQSVHHKGTGALLSEFTMTTHSPMDYFNVAVECQACNPTIDTQTYRETTVVLEHADLEFGKQIWATKGASYSAISTPDKGKTWKLDTITLAAMTSIS